MANLFSLLSSPCGFAQKDRLLSIDVTQHITKVFDLNMLIFKQLVQGVYPLYLVTVIFPEAIHRHPMVIISFFILAANYTDSSRDFIFILITETAVV